MAMLRTRALAAAIALTAALTLVAACDNTTEVARVNPGPAGGRRGSQLSNVHGTGPRPSDVRVAVQGELSWLRESLGATEADGLETAELVPVYPWNQGVGDSLIASGTSQVEPELWLVPLTYGGQPVAQLVLEPVGSGYEVFETSDSAAEYIAYLAARRQVLRALGPDARLWFFSGRADVLVGSLGSRITVIMWGDKSGAIVAPDVRVDAAPTGQLLSGEAAVSALRQIGLAGE